MILMKVGKAAIPTVDRMVHYVLSQADVAAIARNRSEHPHQEGVEPCAGEHVAMMITAVWIASVNGRLFPDGTDSLWVKGIPQGEGPGTWHWPEQFD